MEQYEQSLSAVFNRFGRDLGYRQRGKPFKTWKISVFGGGASRLVTVNFNRSGGTLPCCRSSAVDNSDVDARNGIIKNCVSISPMI